MSNNKTTKLISTDCMETTLQALHKELEENKYVLPVASSSLGGVKTTSTVTNNSGYTACPIISGIPYYKDTDTDTKVLQSSSTTSNYRPLMLGHYNTTDTTVLDTSVTNQIYANKYIYAQPSTGTIFANTFNGNLSGNANTATKLETSRTFLTNLASTSSASFNGTGNVTPGVKGILPVTNGGTGQNSIGQAANAFMNALSVGGSVPQDNDYFISQYAGGGTTNITYHRRPISTVWSYIKGKADNTYALTSHSHSYIPLSGSTAITGILKTKAEIQSTSANAFRMVCGNYGTILRNDGTNTYVLLTNSEDQYGSWNTLRPLTISNSTGVVSFGNGIKGTLTGNASTATKLSTARTIALTGSVTGSGSFDGSGNLSIATTTNHDHSYFNLKASNIITSTDQDTTANWGAHRNSVHWYSKTGQLIDQPSQYGFILNTTNGGAEVHQLWLTQSTGNILHRGGNGSGWTGTWRTLLDSSNYKGYCTPANIGAATSGHTHNYAGSSSAGGIANNSDMVDGYHANSLWRSDGATWNEKANVICSGTTEWSFDITDTSSSPGGAYWQVWSGNNSSSILSCYPYSNRVEINGQLVMKTCNSISSRHLDGSTDGYNGELYLNYNHPNSNIMFGNAGYKIAENGSYYNGNSAAIRSTGFGNGNLTYLQTSGDFDGNTNWCHYIIANHGDGASYYHYTIGLPFWDVPIYKRQMGNTSSISGWHKFYTSENITYGTWSLTSGSSSLATGSIYLQYE